MAESAGDAAEFIREYGPIAERIGRELNVDPKILLAKFGLETGWGKGIIPGTYNLGNIKSPSGRGAMATDNVTRSRDAYLKFEDPEVFADYYVDFIRRQYPRAVGAGSDIGAFTTALRPGQRGGYAEDPEYAGKIANAVSLVDSRMQSMQGTDEQQRAREQMGVGSPTVAEELRPDPSAEPLVSDENQAVRSIDDAAMAGAGVGLVAGQVAKKTPPLRNARYEAAAERLATARDRLAEARRVAGPRSVPELDAEFRRAQMMYQNANRELEQLSGRGAPAGVAPVGGAPAGAAPEAPQGRASGPRVAGASASANYARAMAGQEHQLPERLISEVEDYTKSNPKGAHALIQQDLDRLSKIQGIGAGDYRLTAPSPGQLMVPPAIAAQRQQVDAAREAQMRSAAAQEDAARRARAEAMAQERAIAAQARQDAQRALMEGRRGQAGVQSAESAANVAREALERTPPGARGMFQRTGEMTARTAPRLLGAAAGAGVVLSADEALQRYYAGDYSGMVIPTLEAVFGSLSMIPPIGPVAAGARGVGMLGSGAMLGLQGIRALSENRGRAPGVRSALEAYMQRPEPAE